MSNSDTNNQGNQEGGNRGNQTQQQPAGIGNMASSGMRASNRSYAKGAGTKRCIVSSINEIEPRIHVSGSARLNVRIQHLPEPNQPTAEMSTQSQRQVNDAVKVNEEDENQNEGSNEFKDSDE